MKKPRVFFSFRSPFSWMAIERLQRAIPDVHDAMEFIPFWEPDVRTADALAARGAAFHYVSMSKAKHLYILHDVKRLTRAMGLPLSWPVDTEPWWEPSHLGWLRAQQIGAGAGFYAEIVAARWHRAENISDPSVVRAAAVRAHVDPDAIAGAVDDPDIRAQGAACLAAAYDDDIFGVPFFRLGRERFWGVDRVEAFLHTIGRDGIGTANLPQPLARPSSGAIDGIPDGVRELVGVYDTDAAGGCG